MKYPEHEKVKKVQKESQAIGQFLELSDYTLCEELDWDEWVPVIKPIEKILAEYFGIDYDAFMDEKDQMLKEFKNGTA